MIFFAQARAESELHLVTAAFFRSSTKDVVTTGAHERSTIDLGAPLHLTTIGTENGATVLVNVVFFFFFFFFFFYVFATRVSFSVMRETRVRFHTIALNITGFSILAGSAKRASMCYGQETEPRLTFLCATFQTKPFELPSTIANHLLFIEENNCLVLVISFIKDIKKATFSDLSTITH